MRPLARPSFGGAPRRGAGCAAIALALLLAIPVLDGGRSSSGVATGTAAQYPVGSPPIIVAPGYSPTTSDRDLGPVNPTQSIDVAVGLAPSDPAGLAAITLLEYTPGTPEYRHFLTPSEIADRFGPPASAYDRAAAYFETAGLMVHASPDRLLLTVDGPASKVGPAFHTAFERFDSGGRTVFTHTTPATLPSGYDWAGVLGLGNLTEVRPASIASERLVTPTPSAGCSFAVPLPPCAIDVAYNLTPLLAGGDNGTGFRIGVVDTYDAQENQTTLASDYTAFTKAFGLPKGTVNFVYPVPTSRNLNATYTGWSLEEALDIEWSRASAPGATIDMTLAPDPTAGLYGSVDWLVAHQSVDVISLSWGEPDVGQYNTYAGACASACNASSDGSYTLLHPVLAEAAAEGIGVFAASGDCGAAEGTNGLSTSYPSSDPSVVGVGGTVLTMRNSSYAGETGWTGNDTGATSPGCQNQGGSGGGFSPFPRPTWQAAPGVPLTPSTRGVPDVSFVGGTGVAIVYNGVSTGVEGTSAATPMWAGLEGIANQYAGFDLGDLDPSLYAIARGSSATSVFHDITSGWNGYSAGAGWDAVTGLGSVRAQKLVPLLASTPVPASTLAISVGASPRIGPVGMTSILNVTATGGSGIYRIEDIDFGDGNASLAVAGAATHRYVHPGVYVARATVIDSSDATAVSSPLAIVVGGGALNVSLLPSKLSVSRGGSIAFTANASGGRAPYRYWFSFGDGTYFDNTTLNRTSHTYSVSGGVCAAVVVADSATPPSGGVSDRVAISVGGATAPSCGNPTPLNATVNSTVVAADLPGDLPLTFHSTGGYAPISVRYTSNDPYVGACSCGIFRTPGNHTVRAWVNDSLNEETTAVLNVTLYPALVGDFTHSPLTGPAPFTVNFAANSSGGHGADPATTNWTFGDGASRSGQSVSHVYAAPGFYQVVGVLADAAGGVTSVSYLVDVTSATVASGPGVTVTVSPAVRVPAGTLVAFDATPQGGTGPWTIRWSLSDGGSAFGPAMDQTFPATACLRTAACPLAVTVNATDAAGQSVNGTLDLAPAVQGNASAIALTDVVGPANGTTPFHLNGTAAIAGPIPATIAWAFGDGGVASGTSVTHTYFVPGNFTLTEIATSAVGDLLERTHAVVVTGPPAQPPVVVATATPTSGLGPMSVGFSAVASNGTPPYQFAWRFGDGQGGSGATIAHTYAPGRYNATVNVTDANLDTASQTIPIVVYSVTTVGLALSVDRSMVAPESTLVATVVAAPACGVLSTPRCAPGTVRLSLSFRPAGGGLPVSAGTATPSSWGEVNDTIVAPTIPASYELNVSVVGPNFTGSVQVPVVVEAPTATAMLPLGFPEVMLLAAATVGAAAVIAVVLVLRRRRRTSAEGRR